jgi:CHAT domain-containing protein/tetratricopeptide (TPR) repeat protein
MQRIVALIFIVMTCLWAAAARAQSDDVNALEKKVQQLDQAGNYADALAVQRRLAVEVEKTETASAGRPGAKTADALVAVSWYAVLSHDFDLALAASERVHALSPGNLLAETNRAHALLFKGHLNEARALYLAYKGKPISLVSDKMWEDAIAADVDELRKAGLGSATLKKIVTALGGNADKYNDKNQFNPVVQELYEAGKYAEALPLAQRYAEEMQSGHGATAVQYADALTSLGDVYRALGRAAEAESFYKRALAINEQMRQPENLRVGVDLNDLGSLYYDQLRYPEAESFMKRAVVMYEKAVGRDHRFVGSALGMLATIISLQLRQGEAIPLFERAIAIAENVLGPEHAEVADLLVLLGQAHSLQGHYAEGKPLLTRALAIKEKALGPDHPAIADALVALGQLDVMLGGYPDAEPLLARALAVKEKALGPDHPEVATVLLSLGELKGAQGRDAEAEPFYQRALAIKEKALGPESPEVAHMLVAIGQSYFMRGRFAEVEPFFRRAIAIDEKAFGRDHPNSSLALRALGQLYELQGRYAEAGPLFERELAITEKARGSEHPLVANALTALAQLYQAQGRYAEAEPLYRRAIAIDEKAFGRDNLIVAIAIGLLGSVIEAEGRLVEAEALYRRQIEVAQKALGPDHPSLGFAFNDLAHLYFSQGDWQRAVEYGRSSTGVTIRRVLRGVSVGEPLTGKSKSEALTWSSQFVKLVKAVSRLASVQGNDASLELEMFQTAQWAQSSEAAASIAQMAARGAKGDQALSVLVRERQDLVAEWQKRDAARDQAVAQPSDKRDAQAEAANIAQIARIDGRIAAIDKRLAVEFPEFAALASPAPLSIDEVQALLGDDEALVLFFDTREIKPTPQETFIWVVTKTGVRWVRAEVGTEDLTREVAALRCGLDYQGAWVNEKGGWDSAHCGDLLKVAYTRADHDVFRKPLPFDLVRSYQFYKGLFGQIEDLIKDKHLLIVPSGPLTQLPFQVLVTEAPQTATPNSFGDYRYVSWLARKHAITVLPAVSSLKALRELAKESHASEPYIGFGDPLLDGDPAKFKDDEAAAKLARDARCPQAVQQTASLSDRGATRAAVRGNGNLVDVADLRSWVPLPETADELCEVAQNLGVDPATHLYLGAKATETEIKRLSDVGSLAKYRIIHFATHGAVAGELTRGSEPGLILTPPVKAAEIDDGYLSASEVAALKLDADWVILSACNTAAGGAKGAEALSGLARAFFYAGARSLLVSHWEVASDSTVKLITKAVGELKKNSMIGRAEALRRSILSMITDGKDYEAHPAFWAPFVLVGEGAR